MRRQLQQMLYKIRKILPQTCAIVDVLQVTQVLGRCVPLVFDAPDARQAILKVPRQVTLHAFQPFRVTASLVRLPHEPLPICVQAREHHREDALLPLQDRRLQGRQHDERNVLELLPCALEFLVIVPLSLLSDSLHNLGKR